MYVFQKSRSSISLMITVDCLVTWPMNASEAASDLALIQTSLLF